MLMDVLPLPQPYTVYIEPTRYCNLKCFYCIHSTRDVANGTFEKTGFEIKHLDEKSFELIVDGLKELPQMPKKMTFSGLGEPLLNPKLAQYVKSLRSHGYSGRVEIITNGIALTPRLADELINAGLSRINFSIQGVTSGKYEEYCAAKVDVEKLIQNIQYFYEKSRGKCEIYVKIIDAQLKEGEEELFFRQYGNISDLIYVEHLISMERQMGDQNGRANGNANLYNMEQIERNVCAPMTYQLSINVDGDVFPCTPPGLPKSFSLGNIHTEKLSNIWNGAKRTALIRAHLKNGRVSVPTCSTCDGCVCVLDDRENLDPCASELLTRYQEK